MADSQTVRRSRSRGGSLIAPAMLGVLLLAAVGVAVYMWGRVPSKRPPAAQRATADLRTGRDARQTSGVREPMPTGDIPGWHEVFADSFNGRTLDRSRWRVYWGPAGGDPAAWFSPSHVSVSKGMLVISAYHDPADGDRWVTGGVSSSPSLVQAYGKYLVRLRVEAGTGIGHALLLTPADGSWPPEIDFSEDNGRTRDRTQATLHFGVDDRKVFRSLGVDLTQWHTLGVEWTPRMLRYTIDGRVWATVTGSEVPAVPMALAVQTQAWPCTGTWGVCPDSGTPAVVRLYVDWAVAYAPAAIR